jgi:tetratricopeptide (TPR) repeat protein
MALDAERGVELTLRGLELAQGNRERQAALSNLCAGYVLLGNYESALGYCDQALAENERNWRAYSNRALTYLRMGRHEEAAADVERGQALAPQAKTLKVVKGMLLDETQPVAPTITIDDRRDQSDDSAVGEKQDNDEQDNE